MNELMIADGVSTALSSWTTSSEVGAPLVGTLLGNMANSIFNDSPEIDSLTEQMADTGEKVDELNEIVLALAEDTAQMSKYVQAVGTMTFFMFATMFISFFCGFMGKRIKRLFRWKSIKESEGII